MVMESKGGEMKKVNIQIIAWVSSFGLSAVIFGGIVFMLMNTKLNNHSEVIADEPHGEHGKGNEHGKTEEHHAEKVSHEPAAEHGEHHAAKPLEEHNEHKAVEHHGEVKHGEEHGDKQEEKHAVKHAGPHWTYGGKDGPEHWGNLDEKFSTCLKGHSQSPIDIKSVSHSESMHPIEFNYQPQEVALFNNGHTIQGNYPEGSFITLDGHQYHLKQFHAHSPSEHTINGVAYDLEMHFVHADENGNLAVVGVLAEEGGGNKALKDIWTHLPRTADEKNPGKEFNPNSFLPNKKVYVTYSGSLTTPPCSEGVKWLVMQDSIQMSQKQIEEFASIFHNNARPVQTLHSRIPLISEEGAALAH